MNGNVKGDKGDAGAKEWSLAPGGSRMRLLMEPHPVGWLRREGWKWPAGVADNCKLQVYDLRLDPGYVASVMRELGVHARVLVAGDLVTQPAIEDSVALGDRLRRCGAGAERQDLVVPPRPRLAQWVARVRKQLELKVVGTTISMLCVAPRPAGPFVETALRKALPPLEAVLDDAAPEVQVTLVGERPRVLRIPMDVRELPPSRWEPAFLARQEALVVVQIRRSHEEMRAGPVLATMKGELPPPPSGDLELLMVEMGLPTFTGWALAERQLKVAVRKAGGAMGLGGMPVVRQVQPVNGGLRALVAVPEGKP